MFADGFAVQGCDGPLPQGGAWNALPGSLRLAGIRPDAWAVSTRDDSIAFAEAKTWQDIATLHTTRQLRVFRRLFEGGHGQRCRLYIAVPRSMSSDLDRVLGRVNLLGSPQVTRLHIPDSLLERVHDECA